MTTAWDKGENVFLQIIALCFCSKLLRMLVQKCAQRQVTRWWCLLKGRGFTHQDQASTEGSTELIGKSAASWMPWSELCLWIPSHKQALQNNNTGLAAQGHHEASGGRRLYFISFHFWGHHPVSFFLLPFFFSLPRTFLSIYSAFLPIYFSAVICQCILSHPLIFLSLLLKKQ